MRQAMKAFVYRIENGRKVLPGRIVGPYATLSNLVNYGLRDLAPGRYSVEHWLNGMVWTYVFTRRYRGLKQ